MWKCEDRLLGLHFLRISTGRPLAGYLEDLRTPIEDEEADSKLETLQKHDGCFGASESQSRVAEAAIQGSSANQACGWTAYRYGKIRDQLLHFIIQLGSHLDSR